MYCTTFANFYSGMEQIALTQGEEKAHVQSVLLLTDGLANQGIMYKDGIINQMKIIQNIGLGTVAEIKEPPAQARSSPFALFGGKKKKSPRKQQEQVAPPLFPAQQQQQVGMQVQAPTNVVPVSKMYCLLGLMVVILICFVELLCKALG